MKEINSIVSIQHEQPMKYSEVSKDFEECTYEMRNKNVNLFSGTDKIHTVVNNILSVHNNQYERLKDKPVSMF